MLFHSSSESRSSPIQRIGVGAGGNRPPALFYKAPSEHSQRKGKRPTLEVPVVKFVRHPVLLASRFLNFFNLNGYMIDSRTAITNTRTATIGAWPAVRRGAKTKTPKLSPQPLNHARKEYRVTLHLSRKLLTLHTRSTVRISDMHRGSPLSTTPTDTTGRVVKPHQNTSILTRRDVNLATGSAWRPELSDERLLRHKNHLAQHSFSVQTFPPASVHVFDGELPPSLLTSQKQRDPIRK